MRIAFIGSADAARRLGVDLARARQASYVLVGRIQVGGDDEGTVPVLGRLGELRATVLRERIDLFVLGSAVARLEVFDELSESCLDLGLQLSELCAFYEDVFGHVPTAEINAAWFAHLVDAHAHHPSPMVKRVLDVVASWGWAWSRCPCSGCSPRSSASTAARPSTPRNGSAKAAEPFRLYKLRTMRVGSGDEAAWAEESDPRATPVGRVLRRTHLDELPQLWNVLRGEMSFVGPRPEQLEFVERLEAALPFYRRRHLIRPGLTGWAQVRCGYAGSSTAPPGSCATTSTTSGTAPSASTCSCWPRRPGCSSSGRPRAPTSAVPWAGTGLVPPGRDRRARPPSARRRSRQGTCRCDHPARCR